MQEIISVIFSLVVSSIVLPIIFGITYVFMFMVETRKPKKLKKIWQALIRLFAIVASFISIELAFSKFQNDSLFCLTNYFLVMAYTIILAFISSDFARKYLFQERDTKVTSRITAFRAGFTYMSSWMVVHHLKIDIIICILYVGSLIISQLNEFGVLDCCPELVAFCKLHEFGIVIIIAIKEILNAIKNKKDKPRIDIEDEVLDKDIMKNTIEK